MLKRFKDMEGGYKVVWAFVLLFIFTVIFTCWLNYYVVNRMYELMASGSYVTLPFDMTPLNWVIAAEGTAATTAWAAQAWKKKSNNNYEHVEKFINDFADKIGPDRAVQLATTFLMSNQNNG